MNKTCSKCKHTKPITEFYNSQRCTCKSCHREYVSKSKYKTPERMLENVIFKNINRIAKKRKLQCDFNTHYDIINFLKTNQLWNTFISMYDKYINSNRTRRLAPSILRINASKGYTTDNIKLDYFSNHISTYQYENDEIITFKSTFINHVKFNKRYNCWLVIHTYKKNDKIVVWKSYLPSKDIATYYDNLIKEEILTHKQTITNTIHIKDWNELYPDDYKKRLISYIFNRNVSVKTQKFGYSVNVYDNVRNKMVYSYLPSKADAIKHYHDSYVMLINGLSPISIRKKDWFTQYIRTPINNKTMENI